MRQRLVIDGNTRPRLPSHIRLRFDDVRQAWVVLAPEKVMWPDEISVDILKRCDGAATADELIDALSEEYDAPRDAIEADVIAFLQEWADRRLIAGQV